MSARAKGSGARSGGRNLPLTLVKDALREIDLAGRAVIGLRARVRGAVTSGELLDVAAIARHARLVALGLEKERDSGYGFAFLVQEVGDQLRSGVIQGADAAVVELLRAARMIQPSIRRLAQGDLTTRIRWAIEARRDAGTATARSSKRPGTIALRKQCRRGDKRYAPEWIARAWDSARSLGLTKEPFTSFDSGFHAWMKAGPRVKRRR